MKITIIGSGTCVPSLVRSSCSVLVQAGDSSILLDVGPGTMHRLLGAGHLIYDVDAILLSHFHPDHCGELANFLFSTKYPHAGQRMGRPLVLAGGPGLSRFYFGLRSVFGDWMDTPCGIFQKIEISNGIPESIAIGDAKIYAAKVEHKPESIAYRIECGGKSVVYSGDTDYSESLIELSMGCDVLICESAMPDEKKVPGHLTPSLAGEIAEQAGVSHLVLTHFYPECSEVDIEKQCRRTYSGKITLAEDLMALDLCLMRSNI
ncbi:MBL fold metallo-hydrolase [Desulforegula conservatrix]|uniref:MBL fold metallo-hydrolase n=1 Tax=Desulforegula conservatrix TaxID=153026 RepID=UPI0004012DC9|nr:ribonuclease Z [Desulforegula conservatrix]